MVTPLQQQYLQLFRLQDFSHACYGRLLRHFNTISQLTLAGDEQLLCHAVEPAALRALRRGVAEGHDTPQMESIDRWLQASPDHHLICYEDDSYPALLRQTATPPPLLFVHGQASRLSAPQIALVGSRNASCGGGQTAFWLASELASAGITVTSGMAAGIDTQSHRGALQGGGSTIAVLGTGADRIYPATNRALARQIVESGALVSELPLGSRPLPLHFPQRNRIIAGLSLGVVVVEAALQSGSLITARLALEENREVFAVPGSIHSATARGCHRLLREGARLVEGPESILDEIPGLLTTGLSRLLASRAESKPEFQSGSPPVTLSRDEQRLWQLLGHDPCTADLLVRQSGFEIGQVNRLLVQLEIKGVLEQDAGRYRRLTSGLQLSAH